MGGCLIISDIHKGENVGNDLMQIHTYGDLKEKFSKTYFHFQCKQNNPLCVSSGQ